MFSKNNTLPIGKLLQNAGLISDAQLAQALQAQSQNTKMKLGEILALQEIVANQTIDFFVDRWQEIKEEEQHFPLGYYFKQACLLSDEQIQTVLAEQKDNKLRFGDLVVRKGWLKRNTVEFFLNGLSLQPPQLMSLIDLEGYNLKSLHLERKYADYSLILSRILAWTGGNSPLTKAISHVFANSDFNIPVGMEASAVDKLIESSLIRNWQSSNLGAYIRSIKENLVGNQKCEPILLLTEYQNILLSDNVEYRNIKEQKELLTLGIIVKDKNVLRVTNLIFQQVFNQNWIIKTREELELKIQNDNLNIVDNKVAHQANKNIQQVAIVKTDTAKDNIAQSKTEKIKIEPIESITKLSSLLTMAVIVFLIPLVLVINNYSASRKQEKLSFENTSQASKVKQFCNEINIVDSSLAIETISKLEKNKEAILRSFPNTLEGFPDNCETSLNELRVLAAPQLGKEGRVIEAIRNLCKVPADAEIVREAKIWIEHWYTSSSWGQETKSYLSLTDDCPASK